MADNLLSGGREALDEMKQDIVEVETLKSRIKELSDRQKQLGKEIEAKEKARDNEITSTVAKRQSEIEASFTNSIDKTRARIKMVHEKRDRSKGVKVTERIRLESADLNEEKRSTIQEIRAIFKKYRIPRLFDNKYFFTVFMPGRFIDFITIFVTIFALRVIPDVIYEIWLKNSVSVEGLFVIETVVFLVAFILYTCIFFGIRNKCMEGLAEAKSLRRKLEINKKARKELEKAIRKDDNEEGYGLEQFDEEIRTLESNVNELIRQQTQALKDFETTAKVNITEQLKNKYNGEINALKQENDSCYEEQGVAEERLNTATINISQKYEQYIDKNKLTVGNIDKLINAIDSGSAYTIEEALAITKIQKDAKKGQPSSEQTV